MAATACQARRAARAASSVCVCLVCRGSLAALPQEQFAAGQGVYVRDGFVCASIVGHQTTEQPPEVGAVSHGPGRGPLDGRAKGEGAHSEQPLHTCAACAQAGRWRKGPAWGARDHPKGPLGEPMIIQRARAGPASCQAWASGPPRHA